MKLCGCGETDRFKCAEDQIARGLCTPFSPNTTEICNCACHANVWKKQRRSKREPEKKNETRS